MIELKTEVINGKLIKHYAEDENGIRYLIKQLQTGREYDEAVDVLPCEYIYQRTDKLVHVEIEE